MVSNSESSHRSELDIAHLSNDKISRSNAVWRTVGDNTLLVATAASSQHPDAELANLGVAVAAVGTVLASALLEDGALNLSGGVGLSSGGRGGKSKAVESREDDGGELHVDGLGVGASVKKCEVGE